MPLDSVASRLERLEKRMRQGDALGEDRTCELARLHLLRRDFPSALYHGLEADCAAERDSTIAERIEAPGEHEMARIAFLLARPAGLTRVVSFDYQGDDTRWFVGDSLFGEIREKGTARERGWSWVDPLDHLGRPGRRHARSQPVPRSSAAVMRSAASATLPSSSTVGS